MYTHVHTQKHTYTHKSPLKIEKATIYVRYEIPKDAKDKYKIVCNSWCMVWEWNALIIHSKAIIIIVLSLEECALQSRMQMSSLLCPQAACPNTALCSLALLKWLLILVFQFHERVFISAHWDIGHNLLKQILNAKDCSVPQYTEHWCCYSMKIPFHMFNFKNALKSL